MYSKCNDFSPEIGFTVWIKTTVYTVYTET